MKNKLIMVLLFALADILAAQTKITENKDAFGLVVHGGAGYIYKGRYTNEEESAYKNKLQEAIDTGYAVLSRNGSALNAVEKTIHILEDSPLFNAGKGAVMTSEETVELDAAIMDGSNLKAGAVAGIKHIKSPISLARTVMEKSPHVFMIGEGAEKFGLDNGMEKVENSYFYTEKTLEEIRKIKEEEKKRDQSYIYKDENKYGTVGCAALDKHGNLAAGTSTGGMVNKKFGRVGDVPVIGAGTYANNFTAAMSCTGHGEFFIRNVVAHDISSLIQYKGMKLNDAAKEVIMEKLLKQNGRGGVIGIDAQGNITMVFNTDGMFRGYKLNNGKSFVGMYKE
ncbi:MAG: beta-aspartyl-peptidase [Ignavibacteriales bacterium CG_4_9_14_3_um_filter_34_10]|nr:MAG: beta-aspartyl-peptidase [Ignavibacteriales bacterium CG_4_9_14_3_um_filter_34_10]